MAQISYSMVVNATQQILALRDVMARGLLLIMYMMTLVAVVK